MKKHSARVAPLSACNSPVLTLTKVEGKRRRWERDGGTVTGVSRGDRVPRRGMRRGYWCRNRECSGAAGCSAGAMLGGAHPCPPPRFALVLSSPTLQRQSLSPGARLGPREQLPNPWQKEGRCLSVRFDPQWEEHRPIPNYLSVPLVACPAAWYQWGWDSVTLRDIRSPTAVGVWQTFRDHGDFQGKWVETLKRAGKCSGGVPSEP